MFCVYQCAILHSVWAHFFLIKLFSEWLDVSLNTDAVVQEAQCECAHCKHIASVRYGVNTIRQGSEVITELLCTLVSITLVHRTCTNVCWILSMYEFKLHALSVKSQMNKCKSTDYGVPFECFLRNIWHFSIMFSSTGLNTNDLHSSEIFYFVHVFQTFHNSKPLSGSTVKYRTEWQRYPDSKRPALTFHLLFIV